MIKMIIIIIKMIIIIIIIIIKNTRYTKERKRSEMLTEELELTYPKLFFVFFF